jgi:hypothetical protein
MNTKDCSYTKPGIFALLKGPSGSGKTVGALSFPNIWMADFDRKMPTIARKHFPNKDIEFETFTDCFVLADQLTEWITKDNCPFETLLFDSITSYSSLIIKSIGDAKGESTPQMLKTMKAARGSGKPIPELLGIDYYNAETRLAEWTFDVTKTLWVRPGNPKNILFTAHIVTTDSAPDLKTKIVTRTRSIVTYGKKVAAYIPTQFDEVYLFGTRQGDMGADAKTPVEHIMTTETVGEDDAKTAFKLAQYINFTQPREKPLYDQIQAQIAGSEMFL